MGQIQFSRLENWANRLRETKPIEMVDKSILPRIAPPGTDKARAFVIRRTDADDHVAR